MRVGRARGIDGFSQRHLTATTLAEPAPGSLQIEHAEDLVDLAGPYAELMRKHLVHVIEIARSEADLQRGAGRDIPGLATTMSGRGQWRPK
jgi:hypothetical protein